MEYRAPPWLLGRHAQTLWPLAIRGSLPDYRRERWDTPDGDFIDLDHAGPADAPVRIVLFHGLEGSSSSHYARALMRHVVARGWAGVVVHFRGCSGEPNRLPRAYHSGDSAEVDWVLRRLASPAVTLCATGVSLGGNVLLKWLAERGSESGSLVRAAAAVCAPVDLAAADASLSRGLNRLYAHNFLRSLVPTALAKEARFPGLFDIARVRKARTLGEFDDAVTAPLHGFRDAADYYARSSAGPLLAGIEVPTLQLHARNDPFVPAAALPAAAAVGRAVTLEVLPAGGHVGFVSAGPPGDIDWLPRRLLGFFETHLR